VFSAAGSCGSAPPRPVKGFRISRSPAPLYVHVDYAMQVEQNRQRPDGLNEQIAVRIVEERLCNVGGLEVRPKNCYEKSGEDGGCVETTAVIHRTHWGRAPMLGSDCFGFGRIGSHVAVCPFSFPHRESKQTFNE
jgi:hypothetical protein